MLKFCVALLFITNIACGEKKLKKENVIFFQGKDFFKTQLADLKATPYFIHKIETKNGIRDSVAIPVDSVEFYMKPFMEPDINDPSIKDLYEESVIFDETTGIYSLNYTTANRELELQIMNVLLEEDAKSVKQIFIRKYRSTDESSIIEQLSWKPYQSFESNRLIQSPNKPEETHKIQVVWNVK